MIVRILGVQAEADLGLQTYMKVVLRIKTTMSTILPITSNMAIRTSYSVMIQISLNDHQNRQGHCCPITSTEQLYTVQVSTTRRSTKTKDSNNYLDSNV